MEERFIARGNFLDPSAKEFHPSSQFALPYPQFYYAYPPLTTPPPLPSHYVHSLLAADDDDTSSRAVLLSMVPSHVPESGVTQAMMAFGGVRAVDTCFLMSEGIATVHFYDLRSAQVAVAEIREQRVRQQTRLQQVYGILPSENWAEQPPANGGRGLIEGHAVWAQFAAKDLDVPNQGSLLVSVSNPAAVSSDGVREIFQTCGPVMAVRESPSKPHHKFVEFFDVRDAARAQNELNGREIGGDTRLSVEFSRPYGSHSRSYQQYHHLSRRSGLLNFPLPPRLATSNSQASSSSGGGGNQEGAVVLKRNDVRISNVSRNGNADNSSGSSGRKNKGGSSKSNSNSNSSTSSCYPSSSSNPSSKQQQGSCSKMNWKNHGKNSKKCLGASASSSSSSSRFEIKEIGGHHTAAAAVSSSRSRDSRTTVMIKNIPNKYSQKLLLNLLENHCISCNEKIVEENREEPLSAYDFVYLPIDFNNKCNVGYGFVNLTSPEAAVRLYRAFHMQPWEVFNSRKICQVTYARLQGLEVLKEHFRNSNFACDNDEYMPVVFDPPRDGTEQLTEPLPIIGGRADNLIHSKKIRAAAAGDLGCASSTTASTQALSDHEAGDDEEDEDDDNNKDRDDSHRHSDDGSGNRDEGSDETAGSGGGISHQLTASLQLLPS